MKRSVLAGISCAALLTFGVLCGCGTTQTETSEEEEVGFSVVEDARYEPETSKETSVAIENIESETSPNALVSEESQEQEAVIEEPVQEQSVDEQVLQSEGDAPQEQVSEPAVDIQIVEDYRDSFVHGDKGAEYQKYIVLHDTEGESDPASVISWWDGNGNLVAAHFVVGMDGTIYQCVPLDKIAHHAGYGDAGHNDLYGICEDGRDDMLGSVPIGDWAPDYGMNAWSIGIEMVHIGGSGYYPEEQLAAVDSLIAYIDSYYGFQSTIIDHKAWRSGNSDTSPEFAEYLANYQDHRTHN